MNNFLSPSGGYGRIWECLYEGSMVGAGPEVFCLWPYVIAKMRSRGGEGATVILNPALLKDVFGVPDEDFIKRGIAKLCDVDLESKNGKEQDGRRLVHISGHLYGVVNGADYISLRSKERHAAAQSVYRAAKKLPSSLTLREQVNRSVENDPLTKQDQKELRRLSKGKPPGSNPIQPGLVTDTETLGQMVGEYGEDNPGEDLLPDERRQRVLEKVANEEAACERVRSKMNPKYANENTHENSQAIAGGQD